MQLHRHRSEFSSRGADLVVIGNGAANFIAGFREETGYDGALYTDPSLEVYRALSLERSLASSLNLRSLRHAVGALRRGFRQRRTRGDRWQQGGVFAVAPGGELRFAFRAEVAGDTPEPSAILRALETSREPEVA